jgi:hypothetical protein
MRPHSGWNAWGGEASGGKRQQHSARARWRRGLGLANRQAAQGSLCPLGSAPPRPTPGPCPPGSTSCTGSWRRRAACRGSTPAPSALSGWPGCGRWAPCWGLGVGGGEERGWGHEPQWGVREHRVRLDSESLLADRTAPSRCWSCRPLPACRRIRGITRSPAGVDHGHLGDPLHARRVAPRARDGGGLERAAGDGAEAALRVGARRLLELAGPGGREERRRGRKGLGIGSQDTNAAATQSGCARMSRTAAAGQPSPVARRGLF